MGLLYHQPGNKSNLVLYTATRACTVQLMHKRKARITLRCDIGISIRLTLYVVFIYTVQVRVESPCHQCQWCSLHRAHQSWNNLWILVAVCQTKCTTWM